MIGETIGIKNEVSERVANVFKKIIGMDRTWIDDVKELPDKDYICLIGIMSVSKKYYDRWIEKKDTEVSRQIVALLMDYINLRVF